MVTVNTSLSPHFKLHEFFVSHDYPDLAALSLDNFIKTPDYRVFECMHWLAMALLEPMRCSIGRPVIILSGYRCPELNGAIGGVPNSQHIYGQAVDYRWDGDEENEYLIESFEWLSQHCAPCAGQVRLYMTQNFIHLSLPTVNHRGEFKVLK